MVTGRLAQYKPRPSVLFAERRSAIVRLNSWKRRLSRAVWGAKTMGLSETGTSWACPGCNRRVPMRVENCRCGAPRPLAPAPSTTIRNIPRPATLVTGGASGLLVDGQGLGSFAEASSLTGMSQPGSFDEGLRYPGETLRFWVSAAFASVFWAFLILSMVGIAYALVFLVFSLVARALFLANVRGNGVLVSEQQLPHIHAAVLRASRSLGMEAPPETYVLQSEGSLNAFATRLISRNYVVIYSALIDACSDQAQVDFVVAHEVGHLAAGHLRWMGFLTPARLLPWLGPAYSRACEYTCDRCGLAVVADLNAADRGLLVLAAGGKAAMQANVDGFMAQRLETGSFWSAVVELGSSHPFLCKRVAALREYEHPGSMARISRNPLAYLFAPLTSVGGVAGAGGGLLVMVAVVGIMAAIAIPSLLRARVAANEAAAIGHAIEVMNAQAAFKSMSGTYGPIECLTTPIACGVDLPAGSPVLLSADGGEARAQGYERAIVRYDHDSFVFISAPLTQGQSGVRVFCADARGSVCSAPSVEEASAGSTCSPACERLR